MSVRRLTLVTLSLVVVATACGRDQTPVESVQASASSTRLLISVPSCQQDPEVRVEESATEVRIEASVDGEPAGDCSDGALTVTLESPLGDRVIIDDATGAELSPLPIDN